jgi:exodeoxyribonuclease-5
VEFSPQQEAALRSVHDWLQGSDRQVFRLFGYAGTGKTTLARHFAEGIDGPVYFAAFTGKAAHVLHEKGCPNATTLHKLIYLPRDKSKLKLERLKELLEALEEDDPRRAELKVKIAEEESNLKRPAFTLNVDSQISEAALLVVDEVSMVDEQMGLDLLSFGCKVLVLGDPAQLPPVRGTGFFINDDPDFLLTEIHRQARDNPIIHLATQIRNQELPALGNYGESRVRKGMDAALALGCDQLLVGKNITRSKFNNRIRTLLGITEPLPVKDDRLVCLRNNHELGLLNGAMWEVLEVPDRSEPIMLVSLCPEGGDGANPLPVFAHTQYFLGGEPEWWTVKDAECFDYGYALTCHKSQGSQFDHVVVYDESSVFRQDKWKWLYTAVTRATIRVDLVR